MAKVRRTAEYLTRLLTLSITVNKYHIITIGKRLYEQGFKPEGVIESVSEDMPIL